MSSDPSTSRTRLVLAFLALYVAWGATYLFIRLAVETIPWMGMAGVRFLIAGSLLYGYARWRGATPARRLEWRTACIVGALLMGANAGVAYAVKTIPSGVASLCVASSPSWFAVMEWLRPGGRRPTAGVVAGLVVGLVGIAILVGPHGIVSGAPVNPFRVLVVVLGSVVWAFGGIYQRNAPRPESALLFTAMQMLGGGLVLSIGSILTSQWTGFTLSQVSARSWIGFVYLIVFGSLVGYTSFVYLLRVSTPARVSTYAYVNPVVAVLLGWAVANEPITARVAMASIVILAGVVLVTRHGGQPEPARESALPPVDASRAPT